MDWTQAISMLIGGAIAISGGVASQWATHYFARTRDREKLMTEKAEKLVDAIYAHQEYIKHFPLHYLYDIGKPEADPLNHVLALQTLYFPSLHKEMQAVRDAMLVLIDFTHQESLKRGNMDQKAWLATIDEMVVAKFTFNCLRVSDDFIQAVARTAPFCDGQNVNRVATNPVISVVEK